MPTVAHGCGMCDLRPHRSRRCALGCILQPPPSAASLRNALRRLGQNVHSRLTVFADERVDVHEMRDALEHVLGDARDDHSGIDVADENDVGATTSLTNVCSAPRPP